MLDKIVFVAHLRDVTTYVEYLTERRYDNLIAEFCFVGYFETPSVATLCTNGRPDWSIGKDVDGICRDLIRNYILKLLGGTEENR
jgi:hypothetical protein